MCQLDGDGRCEGCFAHATLAHEHNQAMPIAGNLIDQDGQTGRVELGGQVDRFGIW